ncbi:xanthine dehydrogenase family protein molybdopterin-binding subunit [Variovorax ginsengisoli]|uniref:Molybdopterin-dependent oxidoreductase n=1 Tax=Variovorax ginsengisoli TaxID=363844 RepID=A0ABT8SG94_9BURK|nr:molybdopterin cofactor-binding domain-containing protein [Variovorax ginsengisoli]MDN8618042.1 molybdopterin-dependent oxidoreductase [Variovorax ginsengisoli]MDO1537212.1 molybdopterin-dependent oxidoreductase [Variovorax ginsengisoli]
MHSEPALAQQLRRPTLGQPIERLEDAALLTGRGRYGDDLGVTPGTLHAAVLRSPHAHAELVAIDAAAALAMPGVRAVLTGEDAQRWSQPFVVGVKQPMRHWALAVDRVRYAGEPVAVVVAEDRYLAEDALDAIRVEYRALPAVVNIERAIEADAPVLHADVGSNVVSDRQFAYGDAAAAFADAPHRVALTVHYPRNTCTPIECGVVVAEHLPGDEGYDVLSNFMGPFSLHAVMALALQVPGNKLRHRIPRDSGGSFGVKQAVFPYVVLMCLASRKAGAPVKWVEDRLEHLTAATSATARLTTIEAAVNAEGRVLALRYDQMDEVGGYLRAPEPATFYRMHGALTGAYDIAHLEVRNRVVVTNKTPTGLVRGFGGPQVYFALERLMDRIAVELNIDAFELRRRNFVAADRFPYHAAAGAVLDSGDYAQALDLARAAADMPALIARRDAARAAGKLYGIGCAAIVEPSVSNMGYISTVLTPAQRAKAGPKNGAIASATVSIDLLGGINVGIASAPAGQGHMTVCAQVVADVFGLKPEQIAVNVEFDTAKDAWSVAAGNYSSRFAGAVAGTVHLAAVKLRDKLARIAAAQFDCALDQIVFIQGQVMDSRQTERSQPFARLAASPHWAPALLPEGMAPGLRETAFWTPETLAAPDANDRVNTSAAYGFVFDICGLEVDPDTGRVRVDRYITAHDAGRILNPALADGQICGAFAQGLGAALYEEFRYAADGGFQSGTLADYLIPTACEVPDPVIVHMETPSPFTPLGAKGLGEGNNMSTPVCIANAFADALRPLRDVDDVRLPLTPSRVLAAIGADEPAAPASMARAAAPALPAGDGLALRASGVIDIAAPPERVFAVLLDPVALAKVIPGCHALDVIGANRYRADVTVGVGLVKARYEAQIALSEIDPPHSLRLAGQGSSSLGTGAGSGTVRLESSDAGTRLHYDYAAQVGGKVAAVGSRMLEGAARIVLAQLFESLGRQATGAVPLTAWQRLRRRLGIGAKEHA